MADWCECLGPAPAEDVALSNMTVLRRLYGVLIHQAYIYFRRYRSDKAMNKTFVRLFNITWTPESDGWTDVALTGNLGTVSV